MRNDAKLYLINGTRHSWGTTGFHRHGNSTVGGPQAVPPGSVGHIPLGHNPGKAEIEISMNTHPQNAFTVEIDFRRGATLKVDVSGLGIKNSESKGQTPIDLIPTRHGDDFYFALAGDAGNDLTGASRNFSTHDMWSTWMRDNLDLLGDRSLRDICMIGSHDAGMSTQAVPFRSISGIFPGADIVLDGIYRASMTQTLDIGNQLAQGARWFDLRPVLLNGQYITGHFSSPTSVLGCGGQSIDTIVDQVNAYLHTRAELVVLNFQSAASKDAGSFDWTALIKKLERLNHRHILEEKPSDLTRKPLSDFIGKGKGCVLIRFYSGDNFWTADEETRETAWKKGIYTEHSLPISGAYTGTLSLPDMMRDQYAKLKAHDRKTDPSIFVTSWTLTYAYPILNAAVARPPLYSAFLNHCTPENYPNVIYLDDINSKLAALVALGINYMARP